MYIDFENLVNYLSENMKQEKFVEAVKIIAEMRNPDKDVSEAEELFNAVGENILNNPLGFLDYIYFRMDDFELNEYKKELGFDD